MVFVKRYTALLSNNVALLFGGDERNPNFLVCNSNQVQTVFSNMCSNENSEMAGKDGEAIKPLPLPTITHLQFLVLDIVLESSSGISSQQVQELLALNGQEQRGPKFYQLMKRLEQAGIIESWPQQFDVAGSSVSRTFYKGTKKGKIAWRITLEFYKYRFLLKNIVS